MGENGGFEGLVEVKTAKKPAKKRTAAIADEEAAIASGSGTSREGSATTSQASSTRVTRSATDFGPPASSDGHGSLSKRTRRQ